MPKPLSAPSRNGAQKLCLAMPLYARAKQAILHQLREAVWKPGDKLPIEPELAKLLDVSVGTLRHAVSELVDEGVLARIQGSGTYVKGLSGKFWNRFQPFQSLDGTPLHLTHRVPVSLEVVPADAELAQKLSLERAAPVIHIGRRIAIDNVFCSVDELFLPASMFQGLSLSLFRARLREDESLYAFYEREFHVTIIATTNRVRMETSDRDFAEASGNPSLVGIPLGVLHRVSFSYGHIPIEYRKIRVDASRIQLSFDL